MQYGSVNNLRLDEFNNPDYMKILDSEMAILNKDQLEKFQSLTQDEYGQMGSARLNSSRSNDDELMAIKGTREFNTDFLQTYDDETSPLKVSEPETMSILSKM